jgi:chemotaxis protein MotA
MKMRATPILIAVFAALALAGLVLAPPSVTQYVDPYALLIVSVGTIAITLMRSGARACIASLRTIFSPEQDLMQRREALAAVFSDMATIARRQGPVALEKYQVDDPLLAEGLARFVDGADEESLSRFLERELEKHDEKNSAQIDVWRGWIDHAPAMGLIGTIIGLVGVLGNLSDPKAIGPSLALALLTTLYGAVLANFVGIPMLARVRRRLRDDRCYMQNIADGLCILARGGSPRHFREAINPQLAAPPALKLVGAR